MTDSGPLPTGRRPALWRRAVVRPTPMRADFPRWLVGDWSHAVRDPLDVLRLVPLLGAIATVLIGETGHTVELLGTSVIVLAPRMLDVPRPLDLVFQLGIGLAIWGNVLSLFEHVHGYDKIVHFLLPCGSSMLLYVALCHLRLVPDLSEDAGLHDRVAMVLVTLAFGLTAGGLFEIWEWFSNTLLGTHMYVSYGDSIGDLIDDTAGALTGGAFLLLWTGRGWGTWRIPGAALRGEVPMPAGPPERGSDRLVRFGERIARLRPPRGHVGEAGRPPLVAPRWLGGDWGRILRDPVDLVRLTLLAGALASAVQGEGSDALRFGAGLALSVLVRLADAPRAFDAAFALGMAVQGWGAVLEADGAVPGYDAAARLLASLSIAAMLYLLLVRVRAVPDLAGRTDIHERTGILLTTTSLGFGAAALYEVGAWVVHGLSGARATSFDDLIAHMALGFAASLAAGALLVVWDRAGWSTRRGPGRA